MLRPRVLISLVTYNELENIPRLVPEVLAMVPHADVLVVDDNSPDGTGDWCREQTRVQPRLHLVQRPAKLGIGSANRDAIRWAIRRHYDVLTTMDADFSHLPAALPQLVQRITTSTDPCDVVIGSRYVAGGAIRNWPWHRRGTSWLVNRFGRLALRLPVRDCSSGFRAYRVAMLAALPLHQLTCSGFGFYEEILWLLKQQGARFAEVPIEFVDRGQGRSKADWREATRAMSSLLWLAVRRSPRQASTDRDD